MLRTIFKGNFLFIFAAFFAIPVVVLCCDFFGNNINYDDILKNGIETEATIIENTATTSTSVNDISYYSIEYYFYDENLEKHYGETSESFTSYEISQLIDRGSIMIKYDPKNFNSIEANYDASHDTGKNVTTIFLVVFGLADCILWIFVVRKALQNIKEVKIANNGKEYTATVTNISSNVSVNRIPMYKIHYTWVGESGETISSTSKSVYHLEQAEILENAGTITIKAIGKNSVIVTTPDMCIHNDYNHLEGGIADALEKQQEALKCDYCGHNIASEDDYCSNCGARVNIYK